MSCRLWIEKLGGCLQYMEDCTQSMMMTVYTVPGKDGGRGLIAIEDCVELVVRGIEVRKVPGSEEKLILAPTGDWVNGLEAASCVWFQNGDLKREPESLIVSSQNLSKRTNLVKAKIENSQEDTLCTLCKKADESMKVYIMLVVAANLNRSIKEGIP